MTVNLGRAQEIFADACEVPEGERADFLDGACGDDADLREEVERMLEDFEAAGSFLERPLPAGGMLGFDVGEKIGRYTLIRPLGGGGMGVVYLGQRDDEIRHQAAVKLLRKGRGESLARFHRERQVLASLEHPNIARLIDGGETEKGRPYLVMEYVPGLPIDTYCRKHALPVRARVELVLEVCAAVAYAHRQPVVHRDIKPSNILVTEEGRVKLLDFGIAKPLGGMAIGVTRPGGAAPMTLRYAAPEQVGGGSTTTLTDVYSLGLLLYRLLTGRMPYAANSERIADVARAIIEEEPARPSKAAADEGVARALQGDLDAITLKALRKDPSERYASVEALSDDLRRYLEGLPVMARGFDAAYLARKVARRYWLPLSAAAVLVLVVGVFLLALVVERGRTARERDRAEEAFEVLVEALRASDPERARGEEITAREVLGQAAGRIRGSVRDPETRARLLAAVGEVYISLGAFDAAEQLLVEALELRRELGAAAVGRYQLAELAYARRDYGGAEGLYREALAELPEGRAHALERARMLRGLGLALVWLGELDEGQARLEVARDMLARHFPEDHPERLRVTQGLAWAARDGGELARAGELFEDLVAAYRPGGPGPALGRALADLGIVKYRTGSLLEARSLLEEALPMLRTSMGPENPYVAEVLGKLAPVLMRLGDPGAAEAALREILAILPTDHPGTGAALQNLGMILTDRGELGEARSVAVEALRLHRKIFGERHERVGHTLCLLGRIALEEGRVEEARTQYETCADVYPPGPRLVVPWVGMGRAVEAEEGCAAAVTWYQKAYELGREELGANHFQTAGAAGRLGACLGKLRQFDEGEALLEESLEALRSQGWMADDARIVAGEEHLEALRGRRAAGAAGRSEI